MCLYKFIISKSLWHWSLCLPSLQSKILGNITSDVTNLTLHIHFKIYFIRDLIKSRYIKFHDSLAVPTNPASVPYTLIQSLEFPHGGLNVDVLMWKYIKVLKVISALDLNWNQEITLISLCCFIFLSVIFFSTSIIIL